jgi:hypothetical protein
VARRAVVLGIHDPVSRNELSQLNEQVSRERIVAVKALSLADEAEQPLRVTSRECRHSPSKIRRFTYGRRPRPDE